VPLRRNDFGFCVSQQFWPWIVMFVRKYSIIDRYIFPDEKKLKSPEEIAQVQNTLLFEYFFFGK
jgi:hypothetical protein